MAGYTRHLFKSPTIKEYVVELIGKHEKISGKEIYLHLKEIMSV